MINKFYLKCGLYFGLFLSLTFTTNVKALAQVTADPTLGTQVINSGSFSIILDGTTVGNRNLFHSFSSFNIPNGGAAIFANDPNIANIFARVTGGSTSNIQGLISSQGTANLYLINPNGIIFGANAQLNVGGSFVATTANAIQFPGGGEFSSTSRVAPGNTLLSVNPTAFLFNQIANQGANSIENRGDLSVPDNRSLILLGGRVAPTPQSTGQILLDGGIVGASGGRVEIGGLTAQGTVGLNVDGNNLRLSFPDGVAKSDISLVNSSSVQTPGAAGSNIVINANNLSLNSASIFTGIFDNSGSRTNRAGDITINANGIISLENQSAIANIGIETGNPGNININTQSLKIINSAITTSADNGNNAGAINIKVEDTISLSDQNPNGLTSSISSRVGSTDFDLTAPLLIVGTPTNARGGDINIQAQKLSLSDNTRISSINVLAGESGTIKIQANDSVILSDSATIDSSNYSGQAAGNISIFTNQLSLQNASAISAGSFNNGNAGNINIVAKELIAKDNSSILSSILNSPRGNAGNINIQAERVLWNSNDNIDSSAPSGGNAGNITINSKIFQLTNRGGILAFTTGIGNPGRIIINSSDAIVIDNGIIGSVPIGVNAVGNTGSIILNTDYFRIENNGLVTTGTLSSSNGGSITINARVLDIFTNGRISALTDSSGNGGDITINATDDINISGLGSRVTANTNPNSTGNGGRIFLSANNLNLTNNGLITTRSQGRGIAGNININARENFNAINGVVSATAEQAGGGDINIAAKNINLRNNSDIRTDLSNSDSRGGNIFLTADRIIALEDSDILAFAPEGQGGDIIFNTRAIFSDSLFNPAQTSTDRNSLQLLNNNGRSDINASGVVSGNIIGVPDISFIQNGLTELQNNTIDTNALIANSCIARSPKQEGSFIITGTGGLPTRPGEAVASSYPTGDVQNISNDNAASDWRKGDQIVEPEGVYRLANGDLVMSRECH
jgi:filamentous hemagglutinin family protein